MGTLLEDVRTWWSQHQSERREEAGLPQLPYKEGKEPVWVKERRLKDELPAELSDDYEIKELELNDETRKKIERAKHIFKNDPKGLLNGRIWTLTSAANISSSGSITIR